MTNSKVLGLSAVLILTAMPAHAELIPFRQEHWFRDNKWHIYTHSVNPNTATAVGNVVIANGYETLRVPADNIYKEFGIQRTFYVDCSSGSIRREHVDGGVVLYVAAYGDAWIATVPAYPDSPPSRVDKAFNEKRKKLAGKPGEKARRETPQYIALSRLYSLLCKRLPPQHQKPKDTPLS